ncbi:MAG: hypothetical protein HKN04_08545 [Rhodothermaceae bacterium]|nr:hypothetical protein [Rhodothermaceae bacterium]
MLLSALLAVVLGLVPVVQAQDVPADSSETSQEETALETLTEDEISGDPTELLELLEGLRENPLDINRATANELALIPAFSPLLAEALVQYREANGLFNSLPEIQQVEGLTPTVFLAARPYLTIGRPLPIVAPEASPYPEVPRFGEVVQGLRYTVTQRFQRRLDTARGFEGPDSVRAFAGSPERLYTRLQARYRRNVSLNVTLEKDPGEVFAFDGQPGYDFASAHVGITDIGRIDALIVGDFAAEFGQGLVFWRASGFGKGPDAARAPIRSGRGLRPYGSVDENRFLRGAAATVAVTPAVYASAFASRRMLDAAFVTVDSLDVFDPDVPVGVGESFVTGLSADGLHRTDTEIARKDALGETLVGGALEYRLDTRSVGGTVGVVGYTATFDDPLVPGDRPDEAFDFAGEQATMVSAYANVRSRTVQGFGEVARAPSGAIGALGGVAADLGNNADVLLLARHYPRDFVTLHGYPFGERNGIGQNETGIYGGLRLKPSRTLTVAAYVDSYRFPWLRFSVPRPSTGHETLVYVEHRPRRWLRWYLQGRTETKETGTDVPNGIPGSEVGGLLSETRQTLRLHGEYEASRRVRLRARIEGSRFTEQGVEGAKTGVLVYQDVRWQAVRDLLRLDARLTFFDTDGFDARLYQYENDLTGVFAIPLLSGRGVRTYVLATLEPVEGLRIQAKLAATFFEDVVRISSGNNQIEGSAVRDLGVQLRYTF